MTAYVKTIGLRGPVAIPEPEKIVEYDENGDLDLSGKDLILQSPDLTKWKITVTDLGALEVNAVV